MAFKYGEQMQPNGIQFKLQKNIFEGKKEVGVFVENMRLNLVIN